MSIKPLLKFVFSAVRYAHALAGGSFLAILVITATRTLIVTFYQVSGESMVPTFQSGQLLPIDLVTLQLRPPKIGEAVVIHYKGNPSVSFVKRIEGVPGDTVPFNGGPLPLGPDEFFVVGDHRSASTDSRTYGPVSRADIVGLVIDAPDFIPWP